MHTALVNHLLSHSAPAFELALQHHLDMGDLAFEADQASAPEEVRALDKMTQQSVAVVALLRMIVTSLEDE